MDGQEWQTDLHFLAGGLVTVARCLALPDDPPWIEHEEKQYLLTPVDPIKNGCRPRSPQNLDAPHPARVPFDPPKSLLDRALVRALPVIPRPVVQRISSRYIAGPSLDDAVRVVRELNAGGRMATIDVPLVHQPLPVATMTAGEYSIDCSIGQRRSCS